MGFRNAFTVMICISMLMACGSDTVKNNVQKRVKIEGKVFDDYLNGALVCLDKNRDGQCNDGEPNTTSSAGGAFVLADIAQTDVEQYSLVAQISNKTIDEHKNKAVISPYHLSAPPQSTVINPFTTMMDNQVSSEEIGQALRFNPKNHASLMKMLSQDYIAKQREQDLSPEVKADLLRVQKLGRMAVAVMAANHGRLMENKPENVSVKDVMAMIAEKAVDSMDNLVEEMNFSDKQQSEQAATVMNFSDKTMQAAMLQSENMLAQVAIKKARMAAKPVNVAELALHSLSGFHSFVTEVTNEGLKSEFMNLSLHPLSFSADVTRMQLNDGQFSEPSQRKENFHVLTKQGWKLIRGDYQLLKPTEKEKLTLRRPSLPELDKTMKVKKVALSGLRIRMMLQRRSRLMLKESPVMDLWSNSISADKVFSDGAVGFDIHMTNDHDIYLMSQDMGCTLEVAVCNSVLQSTASIIDYNGVNKLDDVLQNQSSNGYLNKLTGVIIAKNGQQLVLAELIKDGKANFYITKNTPNHSVSKELAPVTKLASSQWQIETLHGQKMMVIPLPVSVRDVEHKMRKRSTLLLMEHQGKVRHGQLLVKNTIVRNNFMTFNKNARDDIMANVDIAKLNITGQPPLSALPALCRDGNSMRFSSGLPDLSTLRSEQQYSEFAEGCRPFNEKRPSLNQSTANVGTASNIIYRLSRFDMENELVEQINLHPNLSITLKEWNNGAVTAYQGQYTYITPTKIRAELLDANDQIARVKTLTLLSLANSVITAKVLTQQPNLAPLTSGQGFVSTERFMLSLQN